MKILGICAYHPDSSACLIVDGKLIAAAEEERFKRIKHWAGFPEESIKYCLKEAGLKLKEIDYVALGRNKWVNIGKKIRYLLQKMPDVDLLKERMRNWGNVLGIKERLLKIQDAKGLKFMNIEHHNAHIASSFFLSPFEKSAFLSVDGFGDFVSTRWGYGEGNNIEIFGSVYFPHSLGILYTAITQFLGFKKFGDEYKVMGLSAFGEPENENYKKMKKLVSYNDDKFELNLEYFVHHIKNTNFCWSDAEPKLGNLYSDKMLQLFGKPREYNEPINERYQDIASALQRILEDIVFGILNKLYEKTKCPNLCISGGVGYNSVLNGKITEFTPFENVFIPPFAGDSGTSVGAAFYVYNHIFHNERRFVLEDAYYGPSFSNSYIEDVINKKVKGNYRIKKMNDDEILKYTAKAIADGKIVGWFQGRMEIGPRALGARSIVVDPRRKEMKDILNERIKRREPFRPFAPSILEEYVGEYFENPAKEPFMQRVLRVKPEKRDLIPAVVHIDGTGRLQTVSEKTNPKYYNLIKEFYKITNIPLVLNTSFNENEPIVLSPEEAIDCFLRTKMDLLVMENWLVERNELF